MPIYEYVCQGCAHRFEVKQSIKDDPVTSCVRCGKDVTKVISAPAIMFKGSGWYITDYSDKMKPPSEANSSEPSAKGDKTAAPATPAPTPSPAGASSPPAGTSATPTAPASSGSTSSTPSTTKSTT